MLVKWIKKAYIYRLSTKYDWWYLKKRAKEEGYGSVWSEAYRLHNSRGHFFIGEDAEIVEKPILPHGTEGIFISGGASIGHGVTIFQQVTIGSNMLKDSKGFGYPIIGDNVYIGAGAKIIGNVCVGDNCKIGANAVVVKDVPAGHTIILDAMRILSCDDKKPIEDSLR